MRVFGHILLFKPFSAVTDEHVALDLDEIRAAVLIDACIPFGVDIIVSGDHGRSDCASAVFKQGETLHDIVPEVGFGAA